MNLFNQRITVTLVNKVNCYCFSICLINIRYCLGTCRNFPISVTRDLCNMISLKLLDYRSIDIVNVWFWVRFTALSLIRSGRTPQKFTILSFVINSNLSTWLWWESFKDQGNKHVISINCIKRYRLFRIHFNIFVT